MRDIYLIDFENVASEGLSGITQLDPEDQVVIFFSNNSKSLSMKMHILIGKSVCHLDYFEAAVGGKNALDHQVSTWLGYLIATEAADRNYYIVSRDAGYKYLASFWAEREGAPSIRCVDSVKMALRLERKQLEAAQRAEGEQTADSPEAELQAAAPEVPEQEEQAAAPEQKPQPMKKQAKAKQQNQKRGQNQKKLDEGKTQQVPELSALLAPYPGLPEGRLRELIAENKKQALCNTLRKQLGQEKGLALYNEIKKSAWR